MTFSQSLAQLISDKNPQYQVKRFGFKIGKKLSLNEKSKSGLYAIVSNRGDIVLRISLIHEIAQMQYDEHSRYLAEAWIV